jgi:predicted transcriptional regulator
VRALLLQHLTQYAADASRLPLAKLTELAREAEYDPAQIAQRAGVAFDVVLRRLASLPPGEGHPPIGLAVCDASGALCLQKPVAGFALQRFGGACPLWPLFGALARPGQPVRQDVRLADADETRLRCFAIATTLAATAFDALPVSRTTMIVFPDPAGDGSAVQLVGTSCRICSRDTCESRREPAIAGVLA